MTKEIDVLTLRETKISCINIRPKICFSIYLAILSLTAYGQTEDLEEVNFPPPEVAPEIRTLRTTHPIKIDGRLDETDWNQAEGVSDFFRTEPRQGGSIRYKTEVKFLFDDKYLYVGAFCADSMGVAGIRIQDLRRDFSWGENDIFGIALDPQNLKQYAQAFQTTPFGNQRDFQNFNGNNFDTGWNTL